MFDLLLVVVPGGGLKQTHQGGEIVFRFQGALHPFRAIASRVIGVFVVPGGVLILAIPGVTEPPFVIDAIQFAVTAHFEITIQKLVANRFGVFPELGAPIVDHGVDEFVFVHWMPEKVKHVTGHTVVMASAAVGGVVVPSVFDATAKRAVRGEFEFGPVQIAPSCPGAAGVSHASVVRDVPFIGNEGGVEVMIGKTREIIVVFAGFSI